jgi:beta-N-acetylhexosaminidase
VPVSGAHDIIGDRAYATDRETVALIGRAIAEGLIAGGVLPVMKHVPGHGRAAADSHDALPVVEASRAELAAQDFTPFRHLADMPLAMTAHVVYAAIDPDRPATTSPRVIAEVVRGEIGFDGLLTTDDLSMKALSGSLGERAAAALKAGCDVVLHCNGRLDEMREVAAAVPALAGVAGRRADAALARIRHAPEPFDPVDARARFEAALAAAA